MKILIIGGGGREHAIGWKLKQNPDVKLYFAPGNGGTTEIGENIKINVDEIQKLADYAEKNYINMTVVGPELPLTLGVSDEFNRRGLRIFGPGAQGAKLEGSKAFAKQFMKKYGIPTARYETIANINDGLALIKQHNFPLVIKADGLAAGKGVIICESQNEAKAVLTDIFIENKFGDAGSLVVIEEFMTGNEVSLLCFTDGETILPMETASDYKRALDNDMGENTGGMGSISPSPFYTPGLGDDIANKTLEGIIKEKIDYRGVIYIGLMLTPDGPKVLEYNVRFGDPETQALLPRLETDLVQIMDAVIDKRLSKCVLNWSSEKSICVIIASEGYPGTFETGCPIEIPEDKLSLIFHAGTSINDDVVCNMIHECSKKIKTSGGRVLSVTATGESFKETREIVYNDINKINFKGKSYRTDIGVE